MNTWTARKCFDRRDGGTGRFQSAWWLSCETDEGTELHVNWTIFRAGKGVYDVAKDDDDDDRRYVTQSTFPTLKAAKAAYLIAVHTGQVGWQN